MSLESQIAELVSATTALVTTFNGKKKEIELALADAVAAVPNLSRFYFVDAIIGDDVLGLGTKTKPYKTLDKALDATPYGGTLRAVLLSDYDVNFHIKLQGRALILSGEGVNRRMNLKQFINPEDRSYRMGGFWFSERSSLEIYDLIIGFPDGASFQANELISAYYAMMFISSTGPSIIQARLIRCVLDVPDHFVGRLIRHDACSVILNFGSTVIPKSLYGKIISGIPAGTKPETLTNVLTNLVSL